MVGAFLTLIGYQVNDTVVVFDRIRENRGKKPTVSSELLDLSINQTVVRSIKTNLTVFMVCLCLFALNFGQRNVLEGFSFVLLVGTAIGSYSTIAIAAPLLLFIPWFAERIRRYRPKSEIVTKPAAHPATLALVLITGPLWLLWTLAYGLGVFLAGLVAFPVWAATARVKETAMA
jgi:hypothetical protein